MFLYLVLIIIVFLCCLIFIRKHLCYWQNKHVVQDSPVSIFINTISTLFGLKSYAETWRNTCLKFKNNRYYGDYQLFSPVLFLKDPNLIKTILIKDFDYFTNRRTFANRNKDPPYSKSLFDLEGFEWRVMRNSISPAYTGLKMRQIFEHINNISINYIKNLLSVDTNKIEIIEVDCKKSFMNLATDIIATSFLGPGNNALQNDGQIYKMVENSRPIGFWKTLKFLIALNLPPTLSKLVGADFFKPEVRQFFSKLIESNIKEPQTLNNCHNNIINLISTAYGNENTKYIHELITSQALVFFFAGSETISTALNFCCYELALNQDIQEQLYEEINLHRNNFSYNVLNNMTYLNMVISESLRKWPPAISVGRCCTQNYTVHPIDSEEHALQLSPGDKVLISVFSLHRDETTYPEPERFDPERFNKENIKLRDSCTYIPFGVGPRNCVVSRFALMEMKIILVHLLLNFKLICTKNTPIPIGVGKVHMNLVPDKTIFIGFCKRVDILQ